MYWIYSLPNGLFEFLTVGFFIAFSVVGLLITRRWMGRWHGSHSYNDIVGFYLAAITVLYGVTLGLIAIGAWTNYSETEAKVAREAAAISTLYRTAGSLSEPARGALQSDLRNYARHVIDIGWPAQRQGRSPAENREALNQFESDFVAITPATQSEAIVKADIAHELDALEEARSIRLDTATEELPSPLWTLIVAGAFICILVTWFFHMESLKMHLAMTILLAGLLGFMVYMVAAIDNPYRGKISVGPESIERSYSLMMQQTK